MKKFIAIIASLSLFCTLATAEETKTSTVQTLSNNVVVDLEPGEANEQEITLSDQVGTILEVGRYFEKNYPDNFIDMDLSEDVRKFFPYLSQQEVYDREELIRDGVKIYRTLKEAYETVKNKLLVPEAPPLVVAPEDYDDYTPEPYVDAGENKSLVITDIKKVLSYGADQKDYEAYKAHMEQKRQEQALKDEDGFGRLSKVLSELEWRKLPFYGLIYGNPVIGNKGIGPWVADKSDKNLKASLLSSTTSTNSQTDIRGILRLKIPEGKVIPAFDTAYASKPKISFDGSQNLERADVFLPIPKRVDILSAKEQAGYSQDLAIPVIYHLQNADNPLILSAKIDFALCSAEQPCQNLSLRPTLELESGLGFSSSVSNYIAQHFNYLPSTELDDLSVEKVIFDEENKTLRLELKNSGLMGQPDIFVNAGKEIRFSRPRIAINGEKMTALLDASGNTKMLTGREVEIIVVKDKYNALRTYKEVKAASIFDFMSEKLTLGLMFLALLGGFILNFMPCVFPVLSLKLLSVAEFGAQNKTKLKKSFLFTVIGIYATFLLLAGLLAGLKTLGYAVGWGMQFQNPIFVTLMLFIITLFIAQIKGYYSITLPDVLTRLSLSLGDKSALRHIFTGILVVVMSTPCTAPYLGTTIGFALAGSVGDIFAILSMVAIGVSLPYLLFIIVPDVSIFIPKPGPWMARLEHWMNFLLVLTIVWLLSILWSQIGIIPVFRLSGYLALFFFFVWFSQKVINQIELTEPETEVKQGAQKIIKRFFWLLSILLLLLSAWDVKTSFNNARQVAQTQNIEKLDLSQIAQDVRDGKIVLVNVGASWCLTCTYNDYLVFGNISVKKLMNEYKIKVINVDWTNYNAEILAFMERFGRKGIPFSILFTPNIPEGMVLPEIMTERELSEILRSVAQ